jgi:hypothetical protein
MELSGRNMIAHCGKYMLSMSRKEFPVASGSKLLKGLRIGAENIIESVKQEQVTKIPEVRANFTMIRCGATLYLMAPCRMKF